MTREELLKAVNAKEDTSKLTSLSQQTIEEELDDLLEDYGEGEEPDDKAVEKLAKRLKRMDGNIHAGVSGEMKKNREEAERRRREAERKRREAERKRVDGGSDGGDGGSDGGSDADARYASLEAKLNQLIEANAARDKAAKKAALLESVRKGLKSKFESAGLELNDFFVETAMSKLSMPDEVADVKSLVAEAESIYTADYKRATGNSGVPRAGSQGGRHEDTRIDAHEWDDIKEACKSGRAMGTVK